MKRGFVLSLLIFAVIGVFFFLDFAQHHPSKYPGGPDIPLSGDRRWVLPSIDDFSQSDIAYLAQDDRRLISGVLVRDVGNYVFMRVEILNDLSLGGGEEKDLLLVFSWSGQGRDNSSIPGTTPRITIPKGWDASVLVRDNAGSTLWGRGGGELFPTHIVLTYFDRVSPSITLVFSKMLLITAGWDGKSSVSASAIVFRENGEKLKDYEAMGTLQAARWGGGGWTWTPDWVTVTDTGTP